MDQFEAVYYCEFGCADNIFPFTVMLSKYSA